jgi:hypothetical protein
MKRLLAAVALLLAVAGPAAAEDVATYETDGAADTAVADARTRALDVAFAAAVRRALTEVVPAAELARRKDELDRQLVTRARLWVASFKVLRQADAGGTLRLTAAVRIDRERLRAKLAELGVPLLPAAPVAPPVAAPRAATVLMRVVNPGGVMATYGAGASREIPASEAVAAAVQATGLSVVPAPASGPAVSPEGALPLDDAAARALATAAGAQVAVIVSVGLDGAGAVRASRQTGALAHARVRVLGVDGALMGEGTAQGGAYAGSEVPAMNGALIRAASLAVTAALPTARGEVAGAPPRPAPPPPLAAAKGEVLVRVRGTTTWSTIGALRQQLSTTAGIDRVRIDRLGADEVVLAVTTGQRADRVAAAAKATADLRARVLTEDGVVEVILAGTTP